MSSGLKDAAQLTLTVMRRAIACGMTLKDANAANVQFLGSRPVFIDTLSFERIRPEPWVAYRQFCQHFVAPLALASFTDARLGRLALAYPDGIPLDLASRLLPRSTFARPCILTHIHLHAAAERRLGRGRRPPKLPARQDAPSRLLTLVEHLEGCVERLTWRPTGDWVRYYDSLSRYTNQDFARKEAVIRRWLERVKPKVVWDVGANTGHYSYIAADYADLTVALDADLGCIERLYLQLGSSGFPVGSRA